jgi:hypothetical protein
MNKQRTVYHLIVDRSGSMSDCIEATINGFNEQLNRINSIAAEFPEQEVRIGLTLFNESIKHETISGKQGKVRPMNTDTYRPGGSTALLDAIGMTISVLSEEEQSKSEIPTTFVVVVLTDGHENCSRVFNLEQVRSMISRLEETGKWTFSFIGATLDAVDVAEQMAFKRQNSYSFNKEEMRGEVWDKLSGSMKSYLDKKRKGDNLSEFID